MNEMGEFGEKDMMDNFVTFMAGIFRSIRFGASSAHGKANMTDLIIFRMLALLNVTKLPELIVLTMRR